ncbi:hypothetical protein OZ488_000542 [Escherichia coli]|nr:hypothetical protein [Escherichia coli]
MMTVKRMFMLLFRTVIVWPSVLTGCLMMLYFAEVASGGVTGLAQRYEAESARWRDAPEDRHCQHRDDNNVQYNNDPVDGLYDIACPQRVAGFGQMGITEKRQPEKAKIAP